MAHIQITPVSGAVSVSAAGMPLGTTTAALALTEGASRPVIYVQRWFGCSEQVPGVF